MVLELKAEVKEEVNVKEVNDHKDISNELFLFYKNLFSEKQHLSKEDINQYLNTISKSPQLA